MKKSSSLKPISMINMIPLIDIILVLLFVFMISIPFLLINQLPINLSKTDTVRSALKETPSTMLFIDQQGRYFFNPHHFVSISEIKAEIKKQEIKKISIAADKNAHYGPVIQLISFLHNIHISSINLVL